MPMWYNKQPMNCWTSLHPVVLLFAAAAATPDAHFAAPPGWIAREPSEEMQRAGMVAIWQPAKPNGENIALSILPRDGTETVDAAAATLIREEKEDARDLLSSRHHATCHGKQDGVDINMRFGQLVYQFYHVAVKGRRVYAFMYTHSAQDRITSPSVMRAIDSFCPP
ncbi:MAG: hypothetical protein NVSMB31_00510 [Vulcanimicrobiaceae bacterium]